MKNPEVELKLPVIPDIELTATKTAEGNIKTYEFV